MIVALQTLIFFRESLLALIDRVLPTIYKRLSLTFQSRGNDVEADDDEEQVYAYYDDERGVVFSPPVYVQRYAAVVDCLMDERWCGKLEKVVDLGYHDMSFIKYLTEVPGVRQILGVDIETAALRCSSDLLALDDYRRKRENPLLITLFQGNAADPDYRLIGCDAVIAIEMIEHMLPHDLDRLIHNVFGFIKPLVAIFTTPNGDFNVLFKALESNGLRRLDHFFEWSREQFHEWCSNIVTRYPDYSVACRGIGPGPPGTSHLGCCSQMVVFVSNSYQKQPDLDVNSLAMVSRAPRQNVITELSSELETISTDNIITPSGDSLTELQYPTKSSHSIVDIETVIWYQDQTCQCDLDTEIGRDFVMFDNEEMFPRVLEPRRNVGEIVYEIGDVTSRLNNTIFEVKTFSKTTQNLIAKHQIDSMVHTREVIDEISNLTKMLNFNRDSTPDDNKTNIWSNINWGDNAPYWNQYYTVMRVYNYPYEIKSEDSLIIDAISDEINKLLDKNYDVEYAVNVTKLEIPIEKLMKAVEHITVDVNRVVDILEWNGYEIVDNMVIHSRIVIDDGSDTTRGDDWPETETLSDWDTTDVNSTTVSDGSTCVPDFHGRYLHRALDRKVRQLRTMLTADEDVTKELDKVVYRLMKIALKSSQSMQNPRPSKWLQCKLLDLLTLTEKAILRRQRHFIDNYQIFNFRKERDETASELLEIDKFKEDDTATKIVEKYRHLVQVSDYSIGPDKMRTNHNINDMDIDDYMNSNLLAKEFKNIYEADAHLPTEVETFNELFLDHEIKSVTLIEEEGTQQRTQTWIDEDLNVVSYSEEICNNVITIGDDQTMSKGRFRHLKLHRRRKVNSNKTLINIGTGHLRWSLVKDFHSKKKSTREIKYRNKPKSCSKIMKTVSPKKSSILNVSNKNSSRVVGSEFKNKSKFRCRSAELQRRNIIDSRNAPPSSKPIPKGLCELCHPDLFVAGNVKVDSASDAYEGITDKKLLEQKDIASTKESLFVGIVTDGKEETIALRRTIGTDSEADTDLLEMETELSSVVNVINEIDASEKIHNVSLESVESHTIFLYDINEPTTSKGLRHVAMDAQCGPDVVLSDNYASLSAATSFIAETKPNASRIKIGDSLTNVFANVKQKQSDFGTSTDDKDTERVLRSPKTFPGMTSVGIKIKDSDPLICAKLDCSTMTQLADELRNVSFAGTFTTGPDSQVLGRMSSEKQIENSTLELKESLEKVTKSQAPLERTNLCGLRSSLGMIAGTLRRLQVTKSVRPRLSCGGVHVHSYQQRQISEDVIYQGEWERCRPANLPKRKIYNAIAANKAIEYNTKEKISFKQLDTGPIEKKSQKSIKSPVQPRSTMPTKPKDEIDMKGKQNKKIIIPDNKGPRLKTTKKIKKVSSNSSMSNAVQTRIKSARIYRKTLVSAPPVLKREENPVKTIPSVRKSYIPSYLSKMPRRKPKSDINVSLDTTKTVTKINKDKQKTKIPGLLRTKTDIKTELLKMSAEPREPHENVSYVVFRNDLNDERGNNMNSAITRAVTPDSQNSSTCSLNSLATVRAVGLRPKPLTSKRHSTPSRSGSANTDSGRFPIKNRKIVRKVKSAKSSEDRDANNKENLPVSSNTLKSPQPDKRSSTAFCGTKSNVFIAQLPVENANKLSTNSFSKHKTQMYQSSLKIQPVKSRRESESILHKKSTNEMITDKSKEGCNSKDSNMVLVIEPRCETSGPPAIDTANIVDADTLSQFMTSSNKCLVDNCASNIVDAMRQLVEESLDFIHSSDNSYVGLDNTILKCNDINNMSMISNSSPSSVDTVKLVDDFSMCNNASDHTVISAVSVADTMLSFKSMTPRSKLSDCSFADNEQSVGSGFVSCITSNSVRDIFERKEPIVTQNAGALAVQAFSGFSLITEPVSGDQPDYVNLIDSETGSVSFATGRQTASEELLMSGVSSSSYESCSLDEESIVPSWLFQIISQQQSNLQPDVESDVPIVMADEPTDVDENGNEVVVDVSAGAGDGRGIHSDQSQDSSGRGSSFSSSATSTSGAESTAILIDPSAFTGQYEMLRDPGNTSYGTPTLVITPESPEATPVRNENEIAGFNTNRDVPRCVRRLAVAASDADADISSTDTDIYSD